MKRILIGLTTGVAGLALLAGCHSSAPEENVTNNLVDIGEPTNVIETNLATPEPAPVTNAAAKPANPGADFTTDAQTYDDADATGMTSRLPQDNGTEQPAEEKK